MAFAELKLRLFVEVPDNNENTNAELGMIKCMRVHKIEEVSDAFYPMLVYAACLIKAIAS